ncbi:hypothetical protein ANCCAN_02287 [Ancylostoma caninum]|uniref:PAN domain protein n=1 Tax=Ancylostoma caninum TaxID=29170 RepID=A0A368H8D9_ANCCA|nr:hypothetical protein ANCCAN_02287 [Ancylostoma caninum]
MYYLQAAFFLAFLATAQGQCSLIPFKGPFQATPYLDVTTTNHLDCARTCYNHDPKCVGYLTEEGSCHLLRAAQSKYGDENSSGFMLYHVANSSCRSVTI